MVRITLALAIAITTAGCSYNYQFVDPLRASEPGWRQVRPASAPTAPAQPQPAPKVPPQPTTEDDES